MQKNISKDSYIKRLIKNNFFSRGQLYKLAKFINSLDDAEKAKYENSHAYLYELANNNILGLEFYENFLQTTVEKTQNKFLNERVVISSLIAEKLWIRNPQNTQVTEVRNHFLNTLKEINEDVIKFNPFSLGKPEIIEEFTRRFWNVFYKNLIESSLSREEKVKNFALHYIILSNDINNLNKLLEAGKVSLNYTRFLASKISADPQAFRGKFKVINRIFS